MKMLKFLFLSKIYENDYSINYNFLWKQFSEYNILHKHELSKVKYSVINGKDGEILIKIDTTGEIISLDEIISFWFESKN